MNPDLKTISSKGFYLPLKNLIEDIKENSCYMAYCRSTQRRFFSPAIASNAIVVRYYGYRGYYNDQLYLESEYTYYSIYDAMRQVMAYKEEQYDGRIELLLYNDESGLKLIRSWEYELEGYVNMDGDQVIDCAGWGQVS